MNMLSFQKKLAEVADNGKGVVCMGSGPEADGWIEPPGAGKVLTLGPHPDDAEAMCVTLRTFAEAGCEVHYIITALSPRGVTDEFALSFAEREGLKVPPEDLAQYKRELRRSEQIESAKAAGFVGREPDFPSLDEDSEGRLLDTEKNVGAIAACLAAESPDVVLMPVGNDTNSDHALTWKWFRRVAPELVASTGKPVLGLYIRDPKTTAIKEHLAVPFDKDIARWKAGILTIHRTQHERNLASRGYGMDGRILERVNRPAWERLKKSLAPEFSSKYSYAEVFQVELFC
jgi:LmbE family N-acetylglucosaminyl deacetylase